MNWRRFLPHEHSAENEEWLRNGTVAWAHELNGKAVEPPVPVDGYFVRCRICGEEYGVPVG